MSRGLLWRTTRLSWLLTFSIICHAQLKLWSVHDGKQDSDDCLPRAWSAMSSSNSTHTVTANQTLVSNYRKHGMPRESWLSYYDESLGSMITLRIVCHVQKMDTAEEMTPRPARNRPLLTTLPLMALSVIALLNRMIMPETDVSTTCTKQRPYTQQWDELSHRALMVIALLNRMMIPETDVSTTCTIQTSIHTAMKHHLELLHAIKSQSLVHSYYVCSIELQASQYMCFQQLLAVHNALVDW